MKDKYMMGLDAGFSIDTMKTHSENVMGADGQKRMRQTTEMTMDTPYMVNNGPVSAHIEVVHAPAGHRKETFGLEFYDKDCHNLNYMPGKNGPSAVSDIHQPNGEPAEIGKMKAQVREFAGAATEYPRVFTMSEYMESRNASYERMKANHPDSDLVQPPKPEDYDTYLESMQKQLRSRDFTFVGDITNIREFNDKKNGLYDVPGHERQDENVWGDETPSSEDIDRMFEDFGG